MGRYRAEMMVGVFVAAGILALAYLSIRLGDVSVFGRSGYVLYAEFTSTEGLNEGSPVEIAGVEAGKVEGISLDGYFAVVKMRIRPGVLLPYDTIASIRSTGLIGEKFIKLNPGGSGEMLRPGDRITDTEPSISIEELISKYVFSLREGEEEKRPAP
ncbi:MAG: outer membrane lipid asymmetry maintenance protein MlaD [Deltaproteobacteria bacterium]|nr:outer membrane lipid asymmetry maintenance protein MlaD [Deltaproteobacteria bacterium]